MRTRSIAIGAAIAVAGVAIAVLVVVGARGVETEVRATDGAMITGMIPHHELAIEMAELAAKRSERPRIQELAEAVIATQRREIAELEHVHMRLFGEHPAHADHGSLGLSHEEMGMEMDLGELAADPEFDRAFIDMMIPHHQGAIRMARVQLERGGDEELWAISRAIVATQSREIERMNEWRSAWYGEPSPAGGVPTEEDFEPPSHEEMGH